MPKDGLREMKRPVCSPMLEHCGMRVLSGGLGLLRARACVPMPVPVPVCEAQALESRQTREGVVVEGGEDGTRT